MTKEELQIGMRIMDKRIDSIVSDLKATCEQYGCEFKEEGKGYRIVLNGLSTRHPDICQKIKTKTEIVLATLLDARKNLEQQYPESLHQACNYSCRK